jgi:hypothetical protein
VDALNHRAIVAGGTLVGLWEYDAAAQRVGTRVWSTNKARRARVAAAGEETGRFIRNQLGDAKLSAVAQPAHREERIAFLASRR